MNRTTAIILTIVTALFCGLPGIGLMCFAGLGVLGINAPGFSEQNPGADPRYAYLGAGTFVCIGLLLLVIAILVGVFSFRMSKPAEPGFNEPPYSPG